MNWIYAKRIYTTVHAILAGREDGNGKEFARFRSVDTDVRPRLGRPSSSYTVTDEVKNIFHTHNAVTQGWSLDNQAFCSCSGHLSSNDRVNYQLNFIFIKQLSNSDLQKMVIQFTIWFTPNTVYTLNNTIKHLVHQFNTHSRQSLCIPSQIEYIQ